MSVPVHNPMTVSAAGGAGASGGAGANAGVAVGTVVGGIPVRVELGSMATQQQQQMVEGGRDSGLQLLLQQQQMRQQQLQHEQQMQMMQMQQQMQQGGQQVPGQPPLQQHLQSQSQQQLQQPATPRRWTRALFSCADGESCWWSCWCPCLVAARTWDSMDLAPSRTVTGVFFSVFVAFVFPGLIPLLWLALFGEPMPAGGLILICLYVAAVLYAAKHRERLRALWGNISGSFSMDVLTYCFCPCCAVAQEAQELKQLPNIPPIDYCSGQPLDDLVHTHTTAANETDEGGSLLDHLKSVSSTSKTILILQAVIFVFAVTSEFAQGHAGTVLVICLTLLQPIIVLYFVYWRRRREFAQLDLVVKMFAIGFFWTTTAAMIIEMIVQFFLGVVASIALSVSGQLPELGDDDGNDNNGANDVHDDEEDDSSEYMRGWIRTHIPFVILGVFCMAFIVAATVEETLKHFIYRFCRFSSQPRTQHSILVYLVAGSLGFAAMENLMYALSPGGQVVKGATGLENELLILLIRVICAVHPICAGYQAWGVTKRDVEAQPTSLAKILAPAILVHGSFDFFLMLLGVLDFAYDLNSSALNVWSTVASVVFVLIVLALLIRMLRSQRERISHGFRVFAEDQDTSQGDEAIGDNML